jgi:hypothetical protein
MNDEYIFSMNFHAQPLTNFFRFCLTIWLTNENTYHVGDTPPWYLCPAYRRNTSQNYNIYVVQPVRNTNTSSLVTKISHTQATVDQLLSRYHEKEQIISWSRWEKSEKSRKSKYSYITLHLSTQWGWDSPVLPISTHLVDGPDHIQLPSMCLIDLINSHICLEASTNKALHGFPNYFPN